MGARTMLGETGSALTLALSMKISAEWTNPKVGDLCSLDTSEDNTVKSPVGDSSPFGKLVAITRDRTTATVEVFGRTCVRKFTAVGAISVGAAISFYDDNENTVKEDAAGIGVALNNPGEGGGDVYVAL